MLENLSARALGATENGKDFVPGKPFRRDVVPIAIVRDRPVPVGRDVLLSVLTDELQSVYSICERLSLPPTELERDRISQALTHASEAGLIERRPKALILRGNRKITGWRRLQQATEASPPDELDSLSTDIYHLRRRIDYANPPPRWAKTLRQLSASLGNMPTLSAELITIACYLESLPS
jgi:hypothetical protein